MSLYPCRYRQKRHERNFNKRIKYMCRKTLADSRPRVRGRFARNDDAAAVMPHETKKALAEKARRERKAGKLNTSSQCCTLAVQSSFVPAKLWIAHKFPSIKSCERFILSQMLDSFTILCSAFWRDTIPNYNLCISLLCPEHLCTQLEAIEEPSPFLNTYISCNNRGMTRFYKDSAHPTNHNIRLFRWWADHNSRVLHFIWKQGMKESMPKFTSKGDDQRVCMPYCLNSVWPVELNVFWNKV